MENAQDKWDAAIIGAGAAAAAMARGFKAAGVAVKAVSARKKASAEALAAREGLAGCLCTADPAQAAASARLAVLAVPDRAIAETADAIAAGSGFRAGGLAVHLSGALPSSILGAARIFGTMIGSMHPLLSFPRGKEPPPIAGSVIAVEGPSESMNDLKAVVAMLGAVPVEIRAESKPLYHAAAAMVSNYTVTLMSMGLILFESAGVPAIPGSAGLMSLLAGTMRNMGEGGAAAALTGPVARGDVATVEEHLKALKAHAPGMLQAYASLGLWTVDLAVRKGTLGAAEAEILKTMFARHA